MKKGYSFNEIIIAIFIMSLALSPVFLITTQSNMNLSENVLYLDALMTCTTIMSQARQKEFISKFINDEIIINKEETHGFVLSDDLFETTHTRALVKFDKIDRNFVHILVNLKYQNESGREVVVNLDSGVFLNAF
ncbi:MAG: hypothetical protein ACQESP_02910 [Candidatus Muiribacteriota bacterium]